MTALRQNLQGSCYEKFRHAIITWKTSAIDMSDDYILSVNVISFSLSTLLIRAATEQMYTTPLL